jgi:hypothetical protein
MKDKNSWRHGATSNDANNHQCGISRLAQKKGRKIKLRWDPNPRLSDYQPVQLYTVRKPS